MVSGRHQWQHLVVEKRLDRAIWQTGTHRPWHVHWQHLREAQRLSDVPETCFTWAEPLFLPTARTEVDVILGRKLAVRAHQAATSAGLAGLAVLCDFICKAVLQGQTERLTTGVRAVVQLEAQPVNCPCRQLLAQASARSAWHMHVQQRETLTRRGAGRQHSVTVLKTPSQHWLLQEHWHHSVRVLRTPDAGGGLALQTEVLCTTPQGQLQGCLVLQPSGTLANAGPLAPSCQYHAFSMVPECSLHTLFL